MEKEALRARFRRLGAVTEDASAAVRESLRSWLAGRIPGTIAAYLAMNDEIEVAPLFEALPGWRWVLVRVEDDETVTFRDRDVPFETHRLGMRQPVALGDPVSQSQIDIYLVPGMAFAGGGERLGRGRGFYDRILANRRSDALAVGVTSRERILDRLPVVEHDQRMDLLATEDGIRDCSSTN